MQQAPAILRPLVARIHGPLFEVLLKACGHEDEHLVKCLQQGFPFAGKLPAIGIATRPGIPKPVGRMGLAELRENSQCFNRTVMQNLRPSQWASDVWDETAKDVEFGAMLGPWRLQHDDLQGKLVSRRMPVREQRAAGWKKPEWSMTAQRAE